MVTKEKNISMIVVTALWFSLFGAIFGVDSSVIQAASSTLQEDSHIDGANTGTNYGTNPSMVAKDGSGTTYDRIPYLKFNINSTSTETITSAKLRLYVSEASNTALSTNVYEVSDDTWSETGITYSNAPALGNIVDTITVGPNAGWYEWDVTSYVESQRQGGDGTISLALMNGDALHYYNSKESTENKPELIITTTTQPNADSYVDGANTGTNYGTDTSMTTKDGTGTAFDRIPYLKFDISSVGTNSVTSAKLRLYVSDASNTALSTNVYEVSDDTWSETGITYSNAPALGNIVDTITVGPSAGWYEWDITSYVESQRLVGDGEVTLALTNGDAFHYYNSKENSANKPEIVLTTTPYTSSINYKAPDSAFIDEAVNYLSINHSAFFANNNAGSSPEYQRSLYLASLGRAIVSGNTTSSVVDTFVDWTKKTINDTAHMPDMSGGIDMRQQSAILFVYDIALHEPALSTYFTTAEKNKMMLMAKAAVVSNAYVAADYNSDGTSRTNSQRYTMDGDSNSWPHGNPNFTEAVLGSFMEGAMIMGKDNIINFLDNYSHSSFTTELQNAGLTDVYDTFVKTYGTIDTFAKKAQLVEGYVNNITVNDANNKPFFRGVTLSEFVNDPVYFYYTAVADYTYRADATEGDDIGATGAATEFDSIDGFGTRDSLLYSAYGLSHNLINQYAMEYSGWWDESNLSTLKADLKNKQKIAHSDILGKWYNGYWSLGNGSIAWQDRNVGGAPWHLGWEDWAECMGLFKDVYYNDDFEDGDFSGWTMDSGSWSVVQTPTWSGSTTNNIDVVESPVTSGFGRLVSDYSGSDYVLYTKVKINQFGSGTMFAGLVGRYVDTNNYYSFAYNHDTNLLQINKKYNGGTLSVLASKTYTLNSGTVYNFKVELDGNTLKFYVNSILELSVTDNSNPFTSGKTGFTSGNVAVQFEDVLVTGTDYLY